MSYALRCRICGQDDQGNDLSAPPIDQPRWQVMREGDVATSWACNEHLAAECEAMQRLEREHPTRLIITMRPVDALIARLSQPARSNP